MTDALDCTHHHVVAHLAGRWCRPCEDERENSLFALGHVHKSFGDFPLFRDLDGDIPPGFTSIVGPSGSGKSTLLHILGMIDHPDAGTVCYYGVDVDYATESGRREHRDKIAFVFQDFLLQHHLPAWRNVAMPLVFREGRSWAEARDTARSLLAFLGLHDKEGNEPRELSGGECQRVAVARAIASRPQVILADEPTGNLDVRSARMVMDTMAMMVRECAMDVVLVTHNEDLAREYSDTVFCLDREQRRLSREEAR
jgi:putative ABC transport system ATP-binding protein